MKSLLGSSAFNRASRTILLFGALWLLISFFLLLASPRHRQINFIESDNARGLNIKHSWAHYAPWFPSGTYEEPPRGCKASQVNIVQRHGARYPTIGATLRIVPAIIELQSVAKFEDPKFDFLHDFVYELGVSELVAVGARESFAAGQTTFKRYKHLVSKSNIPFVRASDSDRVIMSAANWTAGFSFASHNAFNPVISVVITEEPNFNNTLDDHFCPAAERENVYKHAWIDVFGPPLVKRLERAAPGAHLTNIDVYSLIAMCAFHTVANPSGALSPFCSLFTPEDFAAYSYAGDLDKYYGTGYGHPLGPVQGVGYVNELIARLTNSPVVDETQTNKTLDDSPKTFPLDRSIYADFSHDNQMAAIFSAMGLFKPSEHLSTTHITKHSPWVTGKLVPFAGRMVVERLQCSDTTHVRILVNDAMQPLEFCGSGNGLCTLDKFIESQAYARSNGNGDWPKCFV